MNIDRVVKTIKKFYTERRKLFFVYLSAAVLLLAYVVIVSIQLFYNPDRALYGATIGQERVQGQTKQQLADTAAEIDGRPGHHCCRRFQISRILSVCQAPHIMDT